MAQNWKYYKLDVIFKVGSFKSISTYYKDSVNVISREARKL